LTPKKAFLDKQKNLLTISSEIGSLSKSKGEKLKTEPGGGERNKQAIN